MLAWLLHFALCLDDLSSDNWRAREAASRRAAIVAPLLPDYDNLEAAHRVCVLRQRWEVVLERLAPHVIDGLVVWIDLDEQWAAGPDVFKEWTPARSPMYAHFGNALASASWQMRMRTYAIWCVARNARCGWTIEASTMRRAWVNAHGYDPRDADLFPLPPAWIVPEIDTYPSPLPIDGEEPE